MNLKVFLSGFGALAIGGLLLYWVLVARFHQTTNNAYVKGDVIPVSSKIAGYVKDIVEDEGSDVPKNGLLVRLDPRAHTILLKQANLSLKEAQKRVEQDQARLQLADLKIARVASKWEESQAEYQQKQASLARSKELVHKGFQAKEKLEASHLNYIKSASALKDAQFKRDQAEIEKRRLQIEAKQNLLSRHKLKEDVKMSNLHLQDTRITAPEAGVVASRHIQKGQYVRPGMTLMYIIPLENLWIIANFKETQVGKMMPGQSVSITIDAFPGETFTGSVHSIAPASGAEFSFMPPDNATGNFTKVTQRIPVKILLKNPKKLRIIPGMSANVDIQAHS